MDTAVKFHGYCKLHNAKQGFVFQWEFFLPIVIYVKASWVLTVELEWFQ